MGQKSRLQRFDESEAYREAIKIFQDVAKPNPETGENSVSISKIALWYVDHCRTVESLKDRIENQKYHIRKLEHQKKYYKALNSEIDLINVLKSLNVNATDFLDGMWHRANPPYFRRKDVN